MTSIVLKHLIFIIWLRFERILSPNHNCASIIMMMSDEWFGSKGGLSQLNGWKIKFVWMGDDVSWGQMKRSTPTALLLSLTEVLIFKEYKVLTDVKGRNGGSEHACLHLPMCKREGERDGQDSSQFRGSFRCSIHNQLSLFRFPGACANSTALK